MEVSEEAHAGYDKLADRHGTTKTALAEALGLIGQSGETVVWADVVKRAKQIDADRRSRRPRASPDP